MRRLATITGFLCLVLVEVSVAQFTQVATPVSGSLDFAQISGTSAWGDYDADGDIDLIMSGRDANFVNRIFIYSNNGDGTFSVADADSVGGTQLIALNDGGVAWGDYDNDGDLDFVLTGFQQVPPDQSSPRLTLLYQNTPAGFSLVGNPVDGNAEFLGNNRFDPTWVDFDVDGDLDLFIGGTDGPVTGLLDRNVLYQNNGNGSFSVFNNPVDRASAFEGYSEGAAAWGDLTGNGYPDLFSEGDRGFQGAPSTFYENNGSSSFSLVFRGDSSPILSRPGGRLGDVRLVDFDNDGDLDLFLSGETSPSSFLTGFYANDGNNQFTFVANVQAGFRGFAGYISGGASWGDYDGDGDSDLVYGGFSNSRFVILSTNVGNSDFDNVINPVDGNNDLVGLSGGSIIFGDYDNDGDLDIFVHGVPSASGAPQAILYQNTANHSNAAPTAPTNLQTVSTDTGTMFTWDASTDDMTAAAGLNYNLRIGTTAGASDVLAPMSIVGGQNDGKRLLPIRGMVQGTSAKMNLPIGTYFWSVQAIDPGHKGSVFATEGTFSVNVAVSIEDDENGIPSGYALDQNFPNPFNPTTNISFSLPQAGNVSLSVFNVLGQQVATVVEGARAAGSHTVSFDASALSSGIYIYQLRAGSFIQTRKLTLVK